ncbi:MAG: radical SAM/SPASM domain-containing protein [Candidatus Binatia bacterium]
MVDRKSRAPASELKVEPREYATRAYLDEEPNRKLSNVLGPEFASYRDQWESTTGTSTPTDRPLCVSFELVDRCNLRCVFCYRNFTPDKGDVLETSVFRRVLDECAGWKVPSIGFSFGEPLLAHNFKGVVAYTARANILDIIITTNGLLLKREISELLIHHRITKLHVSIDAVSREVFREVRGAKLDTLRQNIDLFLELRAKAGTCLPLLRVSFVSLDQNRHEIEPFQKFWQGKADYIDIQSFQDDSHVDDLEDLTVPNFHCDYPFRSPTVRGNGNVQPCCSFYGKHLTLGNVSRGDTLREIWAGAALARMRETFRLKQYRKACKNCIGRSVLMQADGG